MKWRLAQSLLTLREQVNEMWPGRDKSSDGSIGDAAHSARKSDHNPNKAGVVTAIDIDADLSDTQKVSVLVGKLRNSRDPRIKYIIYSGQITVAGTELQKWKPYLGPNAHRHHAHISVSSDPKLYDDPSPFDLSGKIQPTPPAQPCGLLKRGMKGPAVVLLQNALNVHGYKLDADGDFGAATERAVRSFQNHHDLRADGIVGDKTAKELSL